MSSRSAGWSFFWVFAAAVCISCGSSEEVAGERPLAQVGQELSGWTGSMSTSRAGHTATLLGNGRVLVAGGWSSVDGLLTSAELYDPVAGTWMFTGSMSVPRQDAAAVLLNDGRVLVTGGYHGQGTTTSVVEIYDPATGSWTVTGPLLASRVNHSMVKLPDGRVLVVGGYPSNTGSPLKSVELYNPTTGQWTQARPTAYAHAYAQAFLQSDGKVVVLGGLEPQASMSVEVYDPATNTWASRAYVLVQQRDRASAVQLSDGRILLAGGVLSPSTAEIYTPATGFAPTVGYSQATGSLVLGRSYFTLSRFGGNQVLAVGGSGESSTWRPEIEVYDLATGTWSTSTILMKARVSHTATLLGGDTPRLLIAGGADTFSTTTTTAELYVAAPSDSVAPAVSLTSPVTGATVRMTTTVSADASDNVGVNRVEFYCDGVLIGSDSTAPYSVSWGTRSLANGSHTLTAQAYDSSNNSSTSAPVTLTTDNDKVFPTLSVTSPIPGATVQGSVAITAEASDNMGVTGVYFYVNGTYLGVDTSAPYSMSWNTRQTANGNATVTVYAYDATYNQTRVDVSVTVNNDATAPTVSLTSPQPGAITGTVLLTAQASDNVGVTRVDFYRDSVLLGSSTSAPYSFSWDTSAFTSGTFVLTARAYDAEGNVGSSAGVTVFKGTQDLLANGGFEGASTPWLLSGNSYYVSGSGYPASGTGYNELGRVDYAAGFTEQQLSLPPNSAPTLSFSLNITTNESTSSTTQWDKLYVEVLSTSGSVLGTLATFSNLDYSTPGTYSVKSYSLAAYAGQTVRLRFRVTNDSSLPSIFRLDNVSLR